MDHNVVVYCWRLLLFRRVPQELVGVTRSRTGSIPLDPGANSVHIDDEDLDWNKLVNTASKAIESGNQLNFLQFYSLLLACICTDCRAYCDNPNHQTRVWIYAIQRECILNNRNIFSGLFICFSLDKHMPLVFKSHLVYITALVTLYAIGLFVIFRDQHISQSLRHAGTVEIRCVVSNS